MTTHKRCNKCNQQKLLSDFGKCATAKNGLQGYCRECQRAYAKAAYHVDPQCSKAKSRQWQLKNTEKLREYQAIWAKLNAEARRNYNAEWHKSNSKSVSERHARSYQLNPELKRAVTRAWIRANPEQVKALKAKRRAKIIGSVGSHAAADIKKLKILQKGKCPVCKCVLKKFHVDHIEPIARGGDNGPMNLQLLCPPCNLSKGCKDPLDFMRTREFLL